MESLSDGAQGLPLCILSTDEIGRDAALPRQLLVLLDVLLPVELVLAQDRLQLPGLLPTAVDGVDTTATTKPN